MQKNTGTSKRCLKHNERQSKHSQEKRIFLWAFIITFTICSLLVGWGLVSTLEETRVPPASAVNGVDAVEYTVKNVPDTVEEHGDEKTWSLILVNKHNAIPAGYSVELEQLSNGEQIDIRIYHSLQELFDAARADGVYPIVASGYRSTEKQKKFMDEKIGEYEAKGYSTARAQEQAEKWVAIPGTSEHQLGIAVDINADGMHSSANEVYEWLDENSYRFGFIRRYPPDKTDITGVSNEPWHYRYVGVEAATEIYRQKICLEEYLNTEK